MRDPLNFFEPFESLPAGHENQLTRALLVVLRLVPLAHAEWLRMVSSARGPDAAPLPPLGELPTATFQTQTTTIGETATANEGLDETSSYRAISVMQAGELGADEAPAEESDRRAVFDGVIRYEDDLAIMIESKLDGRFSERQAREITIGETAWSIDPARAKLRWRDLIAAWRGLIQRELVTGAERKVLEDFLWLVQRHFPRLQPFSELAVCRGNDYLLLQRLGAILADVGPGRTDTHAADVSLLLESARAVKLASLRQLARDGPDAVVALHLHPADTLEQAKLLYRSPDRVRRLLALRDDGWAIRPNFHFGHMAKGLVWTAGPIDVDSYVDYWLGQIEAAGQVKREDWPAYVDSLVELGIASDADRDTFDSAFTHTERATATPRPGVTLERLWPFERAARFDGQGRFVDEVREAINSVLRALDEPLIEP